MQERMSQIVESGLIFLLSEVSLVVNAECIQNLFLFKVGPVKNAWFHLAIWKYCNEFYVNGDLLQRSLTECIITKHALTVNIVFDCSSL